MKELKKEIEQENQFEFYNRNYLSLTNKTGVNIEIGKNKLQTEGGKSDL